MHLYLVQHGTALPKDENPERPLSESGRRDVAKVASFLARGRFRVSRVLHSGKLRAQETALILADVLGPGRVTELSLYSIGPNAPTDELYDAIVGWHEEEDGPHDVMIVGHLPYMNKMVSRLVAGDENAGAVHFQPGTVVALERADATEDWSISWMVRPSLLGG